MAQKLVWGLLGATVVAGGAGWSLWPVTPDLPVETPVAVADFAASDETVAEPVPANVPDVAPIPPAFDVVRIATDGSGLLAGVAAPGADVSVLVDGIAVATAQADSGGQFVTFLDLGLSDRPRSLTLESQVADVVVPSDGAVLLAPVVAAAAAPVPAPAAVLPPDSAAPGPAVVVTGPGPVALPAEDAGAPSQVMTPPDPAAPSPAVAAEIATTSPPPADGPGPDSPAPDQVTVALPPPAVDEAAVEPAGAEVATITPPAAPTSAENLAAGPVAALALPTVAAPSDGSAPEVAAAPPVDTAPVIVATATPPAVAERVPAPPEAPAPAVLDTAPGLVSPGDSAGTPALAAGSDPALGSTGVAFIAPVAPDGAPVPVEGGPAVAVAPAPAGIAAPGTDTAPRLDLRPPVLMADARGVRVLEPVPAPDATAVAQTSVALDTISYNAVGEVFVGGRAPGAGMVRIYIDTVAVAAARVEDGHWDAGLPDVPPGRYTIRVDQLADDGSVLSRVESPFQRESTAALAAVMADQTGAGFGGVAVKTVQPGHTLWAIARERYGDGIMYVNLYAANRAAIADPDLIYPGQVFVLPEPPGAPAP